MEFSKVLSIIQIYGLKMHKFVHPENHVAEIKFEVMFAEGHSALITAALLSES